MAHLLELPPNGSVERAASLHLFRCKEGSQALSAEAPTLMGPSAPTSLLEQDLRDVYWAPLVVQLVKNQPAMQETWVQSLGWEVPLEKGKATHSSLLAWRISWTV